MLDEEKVGMEGTEENENEFYLGSWKTKEAAEEGLSNMKALLDSQGNEVGSLRKQVALTQQAIEELKSRPQAEVKGDVPDYQKEMSAIQSEMAKLDPDDMNYHRDLMSLVSKSNALTAKIAKEDALQAATAMFKEELNTRDVKATHTAFYRDNPDFNTPEMQLKIKEYLERDTTGMSDPLVAYREIQRDMAAAAAKKLEEENAELKRVLELAKGADATGKVITKTGQSTQTQKQPKATGADLDKGMREALEKTRG